MRDDGPEFLPEVVGRPLDSVAQGADGGLVVGQRREAEIIGRARLRLRRMRLVKVEHGLR